MANYFFGTGGSYEESGIVIFGAPYDSTASNRPGARFAPSLMRLDSYGLETYSPYCHRDLDDFGIHDAGDLEIPFGRPEPMLALVEQAVCKIVADKKIPVMLGGEHLVTLGAVRGLARAFPGLHLVHFDAHADLRDDYLGEKYSHATVMRRCHDVLGDGRIFQFGIRSGTRQEFEWAKTGRHVQMQPFGIDGFASLELKDAPVYITLDLDVLDPAELPGTGTPEAGGVSFAEIMALMPFLQKMNVVGCDLVELAPGLDNSGVSTAIACKILREVILNLNPILSS